MAAEERPWRVRAGDAQLSIREEETIDYGFLSMSFTQADNEKAYRTYFARTQADSDIFWSTASTFLAAMLVRRLKDVIAPEDFWFAIKCFLIVTIPPNSLVYYFSKARPDDHARLRTPALLVSKTARGVVMRWVITPHKMAARFAAAAAPGSAQRLLPAAVLHCIQLAFYSWGFRLPSREQAPFTLWLAVLWFWVAKVSDPLFSCAAFAGPESPEWVQFGAFCPTIKRVVAPLTPLFSWNGLGSGGGGVSQPPGQPCLIVCLWIALVLAFFFPVMLSNLAEEKCRRAFLAQRSTGAPAPLKPPRVLAAANAAATVILFAAVAYGLLEELGRWI